MIRKKTNYGIIKARQYMKIYFLKRTIDVYEHDKYNILYYLQLQIYLMYMEIIIQN